MKEITIKLTPKQIEVVNKVLTAAQDTLKWDADVCEWVGVYEDFILSLSEDELTDLQNARGKI